VNAIELRQPILDLGCGMETTLVDKLILRGLEVFGLDQYHSTRTNIFCGNWLEFDFQQREWGTIFSHMAFSNHFNRAVVSASNIKLFASKLNEILYSLAQGGSFVFSPSIQEIERLISSNDFFIEKYENVAGVRMLDTTKITKR
jgi:hypothetical protein